MKFKLVENVVKEAYTPEEIETRVTDTRNIINALSDSLTILQSALEDVNESNLASYVRSLIVDVDDLADDFYTYFEDYSSEEDEDLVAIEDEDTYNENMINEDTVKTSDGKWTNKGDTGETHGKFKTKKEADAQRRAIFANGFKG